jgi:hypothetical protein
MSDLAGTTPTKSEAEGGGMTVAQQLDQLCKQLIDEIVARL